MTDLHAEDESFLETHARWPCAQLFASCPKSGILFLFARVLFFWPTTIPIIVSAHVADVAPHGCLDALKAWHFPSPDDVTTIVLLPYLPTAQSRTCTRLQDRFRAVNRTATECTLGVNRPAPGRVIEFTLGYVNVDGAMDGLNSMACVPRHECTDEEDIGAALVQLIPYATHARVHKNVFSPSEPVWGRQYPPERKKSLPVDRGVSQPRREDRRLGHRSRTLLLFVVLLAPQHLHLAACVHPTGSPARYGSGGPRSGGGREGICRGGRAPDVLVDA
eukprot:GEMP01049336.1.p1 GENE.GEMP01049336.1~~GEMP01049336.1.p1  ORF type:complete len:276 (+),score=39.58 GEMP01049336.1:133-960(+)